MPSSFTININQYQLDDLKQRLSNTRWPDEITGSNWDYGTNLDYLKDLCQYWETGFDWRKQEASLNTFSQFRSEIKGCNIHYIYEKGKGSDSVPILLTHGYPDSFIRFIKLIPLLTAADDKGFSFDVIVPSIPGYGFSDIPTEKGMNPEKIAGLFNKLVTEELGYKQYIAQGGDWGSSITEQIAIQFPAALKGIHFTDVPYKHIFTVPQNELSEPEKKFVQKGQQWQMSEGAYSMIQGTKPQTLAYGINDSPAGLAGWIIEKFRSWSDSNGDIETRFTKDELLSFISVYWFTRTANSAFRIYYESMHTPPSKEFVKPQTPAGFAIFPKDLVPAPREFAERVFNVKQFTEMPRGGHFAAFEEPELLAEDIRKFYLSELS